jgi:Amt family ammonium transporter
MLASQAIGVLTFAAWAAIAGSALFATLKYTIGIRVSSREEEIGLDYFEHGEKAYN